MSQLGPVDLLANSQLSDGQLSQTKQVRDVKTLTCRTESAESN
jgi:hypothetical protein